MLSNDIDAYKNLNLLISEVRAGKKPLVIWVGAGASTWSGYPLWNELAARMHSDFSRTESHYDSVQGAGQLENGHLPELFQALSDANSTRYLAALAAQFQPKSVTPVFERFIQTLSSIQPLALLTTNIDEAIERRVPEVPLLQRSDFEAVPSLLSRQSPFICKLHGSVSSIETAVFTTRDYESLVADSSYLKLLKEVFSNANVLFFGYSVRDEYVLKTLLGAVDERALFGAGEHFVVCSEGVQMPSEHLRPIRYSKGEKADHRGSLQVLDIIAAAISPSLPSRAPFERTTDSRASVDASAASRSSYFLSDLIPPGTWITSQTLRFEGSEGGPEREMVVGSGYVQGEIERSGYSPMHDVVVGLLCFDTLSLSLGTITRLHALLGSELFWQLVSEDAFRIVHTSFQTTLVYPEPGSWIGGELCDMQMMDDATTFESGDGKPMSVAEHIRRALKAAPGKEQEAEALLTKLESKVTTRTESAISTATRGALMHPSVRALLGISGGTPLAQIPKWVAFPVLRLAGVIEAGDSCGYLNASATRMLWGSERLAGAAFSATTAQEWADDAASYVLAGRFYADLGSLVRAEPAALRSILEFRKSQAGEAFRAEILARLAVNEGGELVSAINAGLRQSIPTSVLQSAQDQFAGLFIPKTQSAKIMPAVWGDLRNGDARIARWRNRSRELLNEYCTWRKIAPYHLCPCGSGEKLKFCCVEALRP